MILRRLLTITILLASTIWSQAQQINAVPDYVFRNQMSVGRNAVTDTAAYFSIGPRYGATKGFMPPIVGDTATFSSGKRNGLLIFSVQKNKFLYWDSVRVQWSDMAGSSGSYIVAGDTAAMLAPYLRKADTTSMLTAYLRKGDTASMLSPYYRSATASAALALKLNISDTSSMLGNYVRHAGYGLTKSGQSFLVDTAAMATRARVQKGIDSVAGLSRIGGSGTTNYLPKFTASTTLGNSQIFDNGTNVGIGTTSPGHKLTVKAATDYNIGIGILGSFASINVLNDAANAYKELRIDGSYIYQNAYSGGKTILNTASDAGDYKLQVSGNIYNTGSAVLAATSGNVGIGTASPGTGLEIQRAGATDHLTLSRNTSAGNANIKIGGNVLALVFENNSAAELMRLSIAGELGIGTGATDAGDYKLQVSGNIYNTGSAVLAATSGNVGIGTTTPSYKFHTVTSDATIAAFKNSGAANGQVLIGNTAGDLSIRTLSTGDSYIFSDVGKYLDFGSNGSFRMRLTSDGELLLNTTTDAGDYKLQVVGNARVGTGKLDIASNTTFGLGVARSGTSEIAGQIYNSNGILYLGAESSAGGQIFTGSSAYAAVIGSGANYPLQFATNNATRATINTNGELLINTTTDNGDFKLQVNGNGYITGNLQINPSANTTGIYMPSMSWTGSNASAAVNVSGTLNTTGAPSLIYADVSDVASGTETNFIQFVNSDTKFRVTKQGDIQTAAPSGGTARKWKLGSVVATSVQLDTSNYVEVEINGTFYRLAIVTPL